MKTTKKGKVIGTETYINAETGELKTLDVVEREERDANFYKIWLPHIAQSIGLVGNKKTKFVLFLLKKMDYENKVCMTLRQMSKQSEISLETVRMTINLLKSVDFIRPINQGVYQVNPDTIFKGKNPKRMKVVRQYTCLNQNDDSPSQNE